MHRYALYISYEGTDFHGWQKQKEAKTIQESVEKALSTVLRNPVSIVGSSRTDSGVHALGQIAHMDLPFPVENISSLLLSLRGLLPRSITVFDVKEVSPSFHARFSSLKKRYHYYVESRYFQDPFSRRFKYHVKRELDLKRLKKAAAYFIGTHDFTAFANDSTKGAAKNKPIKTIYNIEIQKKGTEYLFIFIADGFLYKMVRNLMGTILAYEKGAIDDISILLEAKDRRKIPAPAPAHGLFLMEVNYPKEVSPFPAHQKREHELQMGQGLSLAGDNAKDISEQGLQVFP